MNYEIDINQLFDKVPFIETPKKEIVFIVTLYSRETSLTIRISENLSVYLDETSPSTIFLLQNYQIDYFSFIEFLLENYNVTKNDFDRGVISIVGTNGYKYTFYFMPNIQDPKRMKIDIRKGDLDIEVVVY